MSMIWNKPRYHAPLNDDIALLFSEIQVLVRVLTDWSQGKSTAAEVRDAQSRMENVYRKCVVDFEKCDISMRGLGDPPADLQKLLGPLLSGEPTPEHLDTYLPIIQSTTTRLIRDLHAKRRDHYQQRRSTSMLSMDVRALNVNTKVQAKRSQTLERLVTGKQIPRWTPEEDGGEGRVQYKRERALKRLTAGTRKLNWMSDGESSESEEDVAKKDVPVKFKTFQEDVLSENDLPPLGVVPRDTSSTDVFAVLAPIPFTTNDVRAIGYGGRYVCATCGDACIAPVQVAVDILLSNSLQLLGLLQKWPADRGLHVEINASYLWMSEAFDAATGILRIRGVDTSDLMSIPSELKEIIDRGMIVPDDSDFKNLSAHVLTDAGQIFEKLGSGLKSSQRKYRLKHSPAVPPSITRLLACFKDLGQALVSWSVGTMSEKEVSDTFVKVDHAFKILTSAFRGRGVKVSDLSPLSEELREVLEQTLSEEATPDNWEKYKPSVCDIIKRLLICVIEKDKDDRLTVDVRCPSNQGALEELDEDPSLVLPLPTEVENEQMESETQPEGLDLMPLPIATFPVRAMSPEVPVLDRSASSITLVHAEQEEAKGEDIKKLSGLYRLRERVVSVFGMLDAKYRRSGSVVGGLV